MKNYILTLFQGIAGDRNKFGISGAQAVASVLSEYLDIQYSVIGRSAEPHCLKWNDELILATPDLQVMAEHYIQIAEKNLIPITAMPRCAVGLATLPVIAHYHPDACIIWFDAHADLNTPETSGSGYLGGMVIAGAAGLWKSGLGDGVDLKNIVLTGVRDCDPEEEKLIVTQNICLIPPQNNFAEELQRAIAGRPIYIHIDCDVFDAGLIPSEFQVPGGISLENLHKVSELLAENELVGLEVAEFQNVWEHTGEIVRPDNLLGALEPLLA